MGQTSNEGIPPFQSLATANGVQVRPSDRFEQKVSRIHALLEQPGSQVTWDDRIPDPTDPDQSRQIDVTIRRDDLLTIVECRLRKGPQNVQWIEELMGRRQSLEADTVIAVSDSGFTQLARLKAVAHGIVLRDFQTLTEEEILNWGRKTTGWFEYRTYEDVDITLFTKSSLLDGSSGERVKGEFIRDPRLIYTLLNPIVEQAVDTLKKVPVQRLRLDLTLDLNGMEISGVPFDAAEVKATVLRYCEDVDFKCVVAYDAPGVDSMEREVIVEETAGKDFEILQSGNNVAVAFDISHLPLPKAAQMGHIQLNFGRMVHSHLKRHMFGFDPSRCFIRPKQFHLQIAKRDSAS